MDLQKVYTDDDFKNSIIPDGQLLVFTATENGKPVTRYKDSSGAFGTLSGDGGGGGSPVFELVKVTEYTPYEPEHDEVTAITISGFPQENDYLFGANGTYDVTPDTEALKGLSRVYKQRDGEFYLFGHNPQGEEAEWDEFGKSWQLSKNLGYTGEIWVRGEALPEGQVNWESWNWPGMQTSITHMLTTIPEQPLVLTGKVVTGSVLENDVRTFLTGEEKNFTKIEETPVVGAIHCVLPGGIISNVVYTSDKASFGGLKFFNELSNAEGWRFSGAEIVQDDNRLVFQTSGGNTYAVWEKNPGVPLQSSPRTMSFWFKSTGSNSGGWCGIGYGTSGGNSRFTASFRDNYPGMTFWADDYFQSSVGSITENTWHHYAYTYDGEDVVTLYVDKQKVWEWNTGTTNTTWQYIHVGDPWESYANTGRFADLYIYDNVISTDKIANLYNARTV